MYVFLHVLLYHIAGKFGESSMIHQTKTIKIKLTINNLLADVLNCQTSAKCLKRVNCQTFPPPNFPAIWYLEKAVTKPSPKSVNLVSIIGLGDSTIVTHCRDSRSTIMMMIVLFTIVIIVDMIFE